MRSSDEHMELVSCYLDGRSTDEEVAELEKLMLEDPQLRADFECLTTCNADRPSATEAPHIHRR